MPDAERAAFINAILDDPADDTARLVFADWLEEHGESERAEFIRMQIEAANTLGAKRGTSARAKELHDKHGIAWRKAVGLRERAGEYVRGFLTGVEIYSTHALATLEPVLAVEPVTFTLRLEAWSAGDAFVTLEEIDSLAATPFLRAVTKLWRQENGFGIRRFERLMRSPHLRNLRAIEIFEDPLGADGVRAIAEAPAPFALEELELNEALGYDEDDQDAAVHLLATAPRFASLKHLALPFNSLAADHIRALLASQTLPRTMRLDLEDNAFDAEEFAERLAERFTGGSDRVES